MGTKLTRPNSLEVPQLYEAFSNDFLLFRSEDGWLKLMKSLPDDGFNEVLHTLEACPFDITLDLTDEILG